MDRAPTPRMTAQQTYRAKQVARLLGIGRSTFYTIAWFKERKVRTTEGTVGYLESDVALYQTIRRGA